MYFTPICSRHTHRPAIATKRAGITLIETALVVCIMGVVLAVAIPTFIQKMRVSKISEASENLSLLYLATASYYSKVHTTDTGKMLSCLPEPAGPTPDEPSVDPIPVDFFAESSSSVKTWRALQFNPTRPLRYRYSYLPNLSGCFLPKQPYKLSIVLRAEGDLDGDEKYSSFERKISLDPMGELALDKLLFVRDRVE